MDAAPGVIDLLDYRIHVAPWLLDETGRIAWQAAPAHTYAVVTDEHVAPIAAVQVVASLRHHAPHARVIMQGVVPGEQSKTRESWTALTDWLLAERCGRDTTVIALGGGMVGDLAGFVAATFMRGIPFVQIPTSLLAMVDASVGGKVGVDTTHGKNLVGAFHQPAAVVIDPTVLHTLPLEEFRSGLAEVVKHGVIADADYLERATSTAAGILAASAEAAWHSDAVCDLIAHSIRIKARAVASDVREAPGGVRQSLNFGHSIGHALEVCTDFTLSHGHAVAIGMFAESRIAASLGVAPASVADSVATHLTTLGLPVAPPRGLSVTAVLDAATRDKKNRAERLIMALPAGIGCMAVTERGFGVAVDRAVAEEVLSGLFS